MVDRQRSCHERATYPVTLTLSQQHASEEIAIIPFDIELDGQRYGQWFDFLVRVDADGSE